MSRLNLYFFGEVEISTHDNLIFYGSMVAVFAIMIMVTIVNF